MKRFRLPWTWRVDDQSTMAPLKNSASANSDALIIDGVEEEECSGDGVNAEKSANGGGVFGVKSYFKYFRLYPDADVSMMAPVSAGSSPTAGGTIWYLLPPTRSQRARIIDAMARFFIVVGVLLVLAGAGAILVGYGWPSAAALVHRHNAKTSSSPPSSASLAAAETETPEAVTDTSSVDAAKIVVASDGVEVYATGGKEAAENAFDAMNAEQNAVAASFDGIADDVASQLQQQQARMVAAIGGGDDYWPMAENADGLLKIAIEQDENGNFFYIAPQRFATQLLRADPWHQWKMAGFCALAVGASMVALSVLVTSLLGGSGGNAGGYLTAPGGSCTDGSEPPVRIYASASPMVTGQAVAQQPPKSFANVAPTRRAPTNRISPTSGGPVPVLEELAKVQPSTNSAAVKCRSPSSAVTSPIGGGAISASLSNGSLADRLLLSENTADSRPLLSMKH